MRALFFFMAIMVLVNSVGCYTNHGQGPMEPNVAPILSHLTMAIPDIAHPVMKEFIEPDMSIGQDFRSINLTAIDMDFRKAFLNNSSMFNFTTVA